MQSKSNKPRQVAVDFGLPQRKAKRAPVADGEEESDATDTSTVSFAGDTTEDYDDEDNDSDASVSQSGRRTGHVNKDPDLVPGADDIATDQDWDLIDEYLQKRLKAKNKVDVFNTEIAGLTRDQKAVKVALRERMASLGKTCIPVSLPKFLMDGPAAAKPDPGAETKEDSSMDLEERTPSTDPKAKGKPTAKGKGKQRRTIATPVLSSAAQNETEASRDQEDEKFGVYFLRIVKTSQMVPLNDDVIYRSLEDPAFVEPDSIAKARLSLLAKSRVVVQANESLSETLSDDLPSMAPKDVKSLVGFSLAKTMGDALMPVSLKANIDSGNRPVLADLLQSMMLDAINRKCRRESETLKIDRSCERKRKAKPASKAKPKTKKRKTTARPSPTESTKKAALRRRGSKRIKNEDDDAAVSALQDDTIAEEEEEKEEEEEFRPLDDEAKERVAQFAILNAKLREARSQRQVYSSLIKTMSQEPPVYKAKTKAVDKARAAFEQQAGFRSDIKRILSQTNPEDAVVELPVSHTGPDGIQRTVNMLLGVDEVLTTPGTFGRDELPMALQESMQVLLDKLPEDIREVLDEPVACHEAERRNILLYKEEEQDEDDEDQDPEAKGKERDNDDDNEEDSKAQQAELVARQEKLIALIVKSDAFKDMVNNITDTVYNTKKKRDVRAPSISLRYRRNGLHHDGTGQELRKKNEREALNNTIVVAPDLTFSSSSSSLSLLP